MAKKQDELWNNNMMMNNGDDTEIPKVSPGITITGPAPRLEDMRPPIYGSGGSSEIGYQIPTGGSSGTGLQELVGPLQGPENPGSAYGESVSTPQAPSGSGQTDPTGPAYAGTYDEQLQQLYEQISGRDPFSYDARMDPLYEAYKDQYIQGGKMAMRDTMGQAAALTGGYGSTYSQAAGQQAYDQYMQNLTDKIPELYEMAYGMYKDKGDELLQQYSLLQDMSNREYSRYRDEVGDTQWQQQFDAQQEQQEWARQQQERSNLIALIQATGYKPTDKELQAAGMSRREADKLLKAYQKSQKTGKGGGGGGGRGGSSKSGSSAYSNYSTANILSALNSGSTPAQISQAAMADYRAGRLTKEQAQKISQLAYALARREGPRDEAQRAREEAIKKAQQSK